MQLLAKFKNFCTWGSEWLVVICKPALFGDRKDRQKGLKYTSDDTQTNDKTNALQINKTYFL